MAHIVASSKSGPRGESPLDTEQRATADNVVLLDPTCHTIIDKADGQFSVELLRQWKYRRREALKTVVGVSFYEDRHSARSSIEQLLRENLYIFEKYGPFAKEALEPASETASIWKRKARSSIIPNNRLILSTLEVNRHLLKEDENQTLEQYKQHVDDFEARHLYGSIEPNSQQFPINMDSILL